MKGNILNFTAENAVPAFRFAKAGTAEGHVKLATADAVVLGVSMDVASAEGRPCDVQLDGIAYVEAGGSVSFGAKVTSDAGGKAVAATSGDIAGIALENGASGDIIRVILRGGYIAPAVQAETPASNGSDTETPAGDGGNADSEGGETTGGETTGGETNGQG